MNVIQFPKLRARASLGRQGRRSEPGYLPLAYDAEAAERMKHIAPVVSDRERSQEESVSLAFGSICACAGLLLFAGALKLAIWLMDLAIAALGVR